MLAGRFHLFQASQARKGRLPTASTTLAVLEEQVARLHKEIRAADRDVTELLATPREARPEKIRRARARYRGTGVVHRLLREYWQVIYTDPQEALEIANLAWTAAKASHSVPRIHELVALAASCIGNAARASGDLNGADRWFGHVRSLLNQEDVRATSLRSAQPGSLYLRAGRRSRSRRDLERQHG